MIKLSSDTEFYNFVKRSIDHCLNDPNYEGNIKFFGKENALRKFYSFIFEFPRQIQKTIFSIKLSDNVENSLLLVRKIAVINNYYNKFIDIDTGELIYQKQRKSLIGSHQQFADNNDKFRGLNFSVVIIDDCSECSKETLDKIYKNLALTNCRCIIGIG